MNNIFIQTLLISTIPAIISYFISRHQAKTQIKAIKEQNRADIEKMKEEYKLKLELQEQELKNQLSVDFLKNSDIVKDLLNYELKKAVKNHKR